MTYQKVSASGLILNSAGEILLVRRSETDDFLPGIYELPGGGTDYLEDPVAGLIREIKEECGIEVKVLHPLTCFSFEMRHEGVDKHTVEIIYWCEFAGNQDIKLSFEHSDFKWVKFEELETINKDDNFVKMIKKLQNHPLIAAH